MAPAQSRTWGPARGSREREISQTAHHAPSAWSKAELAQRDALQVICTRQNVEAGDRVRAGVFSCSGENLSVCLEAVSAKTYVLHCVSSRLYLTYNHKLQIDKPLRFLV